jgi:hypothetical protein
MNCFGDLIMWRTEGTVLRESIGGILTWRSDVDHRLDPLKSDVA